MLRFGSVCSGIEAASVAFQPLGWDAAWFSEIEPFACELLAQRYPYTLNLGDMQELPAAIAAGHVEAPDVLVGGTPCQAFSVAGLRGSMSDARGNLALTYCEVFNAIDDVRAARREPAGIALWENVPGVLNTKDNAFGCFLGALAGEDVPLEPPGGRWTNAGAVLGPARAVAWRVLDAQYFGLAQRRKRVFVVASARAGFDPTEVLFEFEGVRRDSAPSREAREGAARGVAQGAGSGDVARPILTGEGNRQDYETCTLIPFDTTQITHPENRSKPQPGDVRHTLSAAGHAPAIAEAFDARQSDVLQYGDKSGPLDTDGYSIGVRVESGVRRLTPRECERLMGFPDDYTRIAWRGKPAEQCPDGPRYKAIGNSWAVPVVRWIGRRIDAACSSP